MCYLNFSRTVICALVVELVKQLVTNEAEWDMSSSHHHHQVVLKAQIPLTVSCHPSLLVGLLDSFHFLLRASLVSQHWFIPVGKLIGRPCLWVYPCFCSSALLALFILDDLAGDCTTTVLWGATSWICLKQKPASLYSSYLAFFLNYFIKVQVVQPYDSIDLAIAWKHSSFIWSKIRYLYGC